jgi:hypothetical protein
MKNEIGEDHLILGSGSFFLKSPYAIKTLVKIDIG